MYRLMNEAGEGSAAGGGAGAGDAAAAATAAAAAAAAGGGAGSGDPGKGAGKGLLGDHAAGKKGAPAEGTVSDGRPEYVPEQFWDKDKKSVNLEATFKSLSDTRQKVKELTTSDKTVPASADGYRYTAPADIPAHISAGADDPSVKALRALCFEAGLSQGKFEKFVAGYFKHAAEQIPAPPDAAAEKAKLGENADAVMDAVLGWAEGLMGDGTWTKTEMEEIMVMGSSADGLRALNKLREIYGGAPIPVKGNEGEDALSEAELYALTGTEKYRKDPAEQARVTRLFERHFGTRPAGSSKPGLGVAA